jgi:hypothetical protein
MIHSGIVLNSCSRMVARRHEKLALAGSNSGSRARPSVIDMLTYPVFRSGNPMFVIKPFGVDTFRTWKEEATFERW